MAPAELLERLCEIHGVNNLNQLAKVIGVPAHMLYTWRDKHAPSYQNTMLLLESAGVLNFESPKPPIRQRPEDDRLRHLEELLDDYRGQLRELRLLVEAALPPRPANEHWLRRR